MCYTLCKEEIRWLVLDYCLVYSVLNFHVELIQVLLVVLTYFFLQVQSLLELPVTRQGPSKMKILASVGAISAVIASGIYIWGKK
jgi:hypothetical protein